MHLFLLKLVLNQTHSKNVQLRVEGMIEKTSADEVMVMTIVHNHRDRLHSYELLAEAFELQPRTL